MTKDYMYYGLFAVDRGGETLQFSTAVVANDKRAAMKAFRKQLLFLAPATLIHVDRVRAGLWRARSIKMR